MWRTVCFLVLWKTTLFLDNQIDQRSALRPVNITFFFSHIKPCSHDPNKCTILLGFVRPKVMKIILQSNLAIWHPKKRCIIVSSFMQKQHCLLPFQLCLAKLSFVWITPRWSSKIKNFTFKGIFNFHTGLFMGRTRTSKRAEYIERTENWPLLWSCQISISLVINAELKINWLEVPRQLKPN